MFIVSTVLHLAKYYFELKKVVTSLLVVTVARLAGC